MNEMPNIHQRVLTLSRRTVPVALFLLLSSLAVYWQVTGFDFVDFDDPAYVSQNHIVQQGLTAGGMKWAFTSVYGSNWHPLTWMSHMLDVQLFGMKPGMHHLTNVFFHILNSLMLFLLLRRMTGAPGRSAAVAFLFALHPLHVESVAWIAERNDVLSTFFLMVTLLLYHAYCRNRTATRYIAVCAGFVMGLMAKPMLVTLPFVLLLLDVWPLNRAGIADAAGNSAPLNMKDLRPRIMNLVAEKIPLFVLSALSSAVTFYAQKNNQSVITLEKIDLMTRLENVVTSYTGYIVKMLWPFNLAAFYPYPHAFQTAKTVQSLFLLAAVTFLAVFLARKRGYFTLGWLWYLGTLIPVIGIVQVGEQSMADRYTYIPSIGLFIMAVWGLHELLEGRARGRITLLALFLSFSAFCLAIAHGQTATWKDSETLFRHAVKVTRDNYLAHYDLGTTLHNRGNVKEAEAHYRESIRIKPDLFEAHNKLGNILLSRRDYEGAAIHYSESLKTNPGQAIVWNNLGTAFMGKRIVTKAVDCFRKAMELDPGYARARSNLEDALAAQKKLSELICGLQASLRSDPSDPELLTRLGDAFRGQGDTRKALDHYHSALSSDPGNKDALSGMAMTYLDRQEPDRAVDVLKTMHEAQPDNADVSYNIACIRARQNKVSESVHWLKEAVDKGFNSRDLLASDPDLENIRNTPYVRSLLVPAAR